MELIYRSQTFAYYPHSIGTYQPPDAINWRYAVSGENYLQKTLEIKPYHSPKAINWRWLPPTEPSNS